LERLEGEVAELQESLLGLGALLQEAEDAQEGNRADLLARINGRE
jgi:hypothetical protein